MKHDEVVRVKNEIDDDEKIKQIIDEKIEKYWLVFKVASLLVCACLSILGYQISSGKDTWGEIGLLLKEREVLIRSLEKDQSLLQNEISRADSIRVNLKLHSEMIDRKNLDIDHVLFSVDQIRQEINSLNQEKVNYRIELSNLKNDTRNDYKRIISDYKEELREVEVEFQSRVEEKQKELSAINTAYDDMKKQIRKIEKKYTQVRYVQVKYRVEGQTGLVETLLKVESDDGVEEAELQIFFTRYNKENGHGYFDINLEKKHPFKKSHVALLPMGKPLRLLGTNLQIQLVAINMFQGITNKLVGTATLKISQV